MKYKWISCLDLGFFLKISQYVFPNLEKNPEIYNISDTGYLTDISDTKPCVERALIMTL
jgi:hypothetical protein